MTGSTVFSSTQNYLTEVGGYGQAASYYGTFDQGGNVWEWNEAKRGPDHGLEGGSCFSYADDLMASGRNHPQSYEDEANAFGFRVTAVGVPEPSTFALLNVGMLSLLALVRQRKQ